MILGSGDIRRWLSMSQDTPNWSIWERKGMFTIGFVHYGYNNRRQIIEAKSIINFRVDPEAKRDVLYNVASQSVRLCHVIREYRGWGRNAGLSLSNKSLAHKGTCEDVPDSYAWDSS